jgi:hypothetical protein
MTDEELAWWRERCTPRRITAEAKRYCADVPAREVAALLTALEQARADLTAIQAHRDTALEREQVTQDTLQKAFYRESNERHIAAYQRDQFAAALSQLDDGWWATGTPEEMMEHVRLIIKNARAAATAAPASTPEPSLREELFATNAGGREVHRSWRDHMLAQSRDVAEQRMTWETLDPLDQALDNAIALDVIRCWLRWTGAPTPTSPEPEPASPDPITPFRGQSRLEDVFTPEQLQRARADELLKRLPIINDPVLTEALAALEDDEPEPEPDENEYCPTCDKPLRGGECPTCGMVPLPGEE